MTPRSVGMLLAFVLGGALLGRLGGEWLGGLYRGPGWQLLPWALLGLFWAVLAVLVRWRSSE
jgi:hypothetical protein